MCWWIWVLESKRHLENPETNNFHLQQRILWCWYGILKSWYGKCCFDMEYPWFYLLMHMYLLGKIVIKKIQNFIKDLSDLLTNLCMLEVPWEESGMACTESIPKVDSEESVALPPTLGNFFLSQGNLTEELNGICLSLHGLPCEIGNSKTKTCWVRSQRITNKHNQAITRCWYMSRGGQSKT